MQFLPLTALWCAEGTRDIQTAKVSERKHRGQRDLILVIRFEIQYKEADVNCFKSPDGSEEWSCFLIFFAATVVTIGVCTCVRVCFPLLIWWSGTFSSLPPL